MNLFSVFIKKPVFTVMLNLLIVLFGYISLQKIGTDEMPNIEFPVLMISTSYIGATPDIVDSSITSVIESEINDISGIEEINSFSAKGYSSLGIQFSLSKDIDKAYNEIQAKLNLIKNKLPKEAGLPIVSKLGFQDKPIIWLFLHSNESDIQYLSELAKANIIKRLQTIEGLGEVSPFGLRPRAIRVNLDIEKMNALGITPSEIYQLIKSEHISLPGGSLSTKDKETQININLTLSSLNEIKELVVTYINNAPILLRDIATIKDGTKDLNSIAKNSAHEGIGIGIKKSSGANPTKVIAEIKELLETEVIPSMPKDIKLTYHIDTSKKIQMIIESLYGHIITGTIFTALVVWIFLQNVTSTGIIACSIPISMLCAVISMFIAGYTINAVTLLGMLLLIGTVVDDSIVVLENIYRNMQKGLDRTKAALIGTQEVFFAVVVTTLVLVAIFGPVIFIDGIVGRVLSSFAVVVTVGVLASSFVSLSLVPMLCSVFLESNTANKKNNNLYNSLERLFYNLEIKYTKILKTCINNPKKIVFLTIILCFSSSPIFSSLGKEFLPSDDKGRFIITSSIPNDASLEYSKDKALEIEKIIKAIPELNDYLLAISREGASAYIELTKKKDRKRTQQTIMRETNKKLANIPGITANTSKDGGAGGRSDPLQFVLKGPNQKRVLELSNILLDKIKKKNIGDIKTDTEKKMPEYKLKLNRSLAKELGIDTSSLASSISILSRGLEIGGFSDGAWGNENYDIIVKGDEGELNSVEKLGRVYLRSKKGELVSLDTIATLELQPSSTTIKKVNKQYSNLFYGDPVIPLGEAINVITKIADNTLPKGYSIKLAGQAQEFSKTSSYMAFTFSTAIILVYMVLASQFNSFTQPLVLMISLPLAIIGGLGFLWLMGFTLNLFSMIGMVLLMGLAAKNSILLIDLTNNFRAEGMTLKEAILKSCPQRMRPVLMTALTLIIAMAPAVFSNSTGSDTNAPLSAAVMGGMISSTVLTLIVIPVAYLLLESKKEQLKNKLLKRKKNKTQENSENNPDS